MWYFAWALGTALAIAFSIMNAIWLELDHKDEKAPEAGA